MNNNNNNSMEKYKPQDRGPFVVFLENDDKSAINDLMVGRTLKNLGLLSDRIISIKAIKNNCAKITAENYTAANKILSSKELIEKKLRAFIPDSHLYSEGVINNINISLTCQEILDNASCSGKIHKVERIQRWNTEKQQLEPTTCIKITFREYMLPDKMNIFCVPFKIFYYISQPIFCKLCCRFGHTKKYCKAPKTCQRCLEVHPDQTKDCTQEPRNCRYCDKANHKTGHRDSS